MDIAEDTEHAAQKNEYTHTDPSGRPFILIFKHWLVLAGSNFSVIEGSIIAEKISWLCEYCGEKGEKIWAKVLH